MRRLVVLVLIVLALPAAAQDRAQTLADIRAELAQLNAEITALRAELSPTTTPAPPGAGTMLGRIDGLEAALVALTRKTEELQFRIDGIVQDGTNRIGDIEFRLVELEGGDIAALEPTAPLGGEANVPSTPVVVPPVSEPQLAPEPAIAETSDFESARALLDDGQAAEAAAAFQRYTETYPGGIYTADAHFFRGEAEAALGSQTRAARAFLESFSGAPDGPRAPEALLRLGLSLEAIGQRNEACLTLQQVTVRFPGGEPAAQAQRSLAGLTCP